MEAAASDAVGVVCMLKELRFEFAHLHNNIEEAKEFLNEEINADESTFLKSKLKCVFSEVNKRQWKLHSFIMINFPEPSSDELADSDYSLVLSTCKSCGIDIDETDIDCVTRIGTNCEKNLPRPIKIVFRSKAKATHAYYNLRQNLTLPKFVVRDRTVMEREIISSKIMEQSDSKTTSDVTHSSEAEELETDQTECCDAQTESTPSEIDLCQIKTHSFLVLNVHEDFCSDRVIRNKFDQLLVFKIFATNGISIDEPEIANVSRVGSFSLEGPPRPLKIVFRTNAEASRTYSILKKNLKLPMAVIEECSTTDIKEMYSEISKLEESHTIDDAIHLCVVSDKVVEELNSDQTGSCITLAKEESLLTNQELKENLKPPMVVIEDRASIEPKDISIKRTDQIGIITIDDTICSSEVADTAVNKMSTSQEGTSEEKTGDMPFEIKDCEFKSPCFFLLNVDEAFCKNFAIRSRSDHLLVMNIFKTCGITKDYLDLMQVFRCGPYNMREPRPLEIVFPSKEDAELTYNILQGNLKPPIEVVQVLAKMD